MDSVVHFEIPADDMARAEKFYEKTFRWKINSIPQMGYTIVHTSETDEKTRMVKNPGAINGGMLKRQKPITSPVITINVADIQKACKDVAKNGGSVLRDPEKVGDMGIAAYFKDSEGNVLGLWQALKR
jgi:predicted enzyme related to lactoylglutathione lyase